MGAFLHCPGELGKEQLWQAPVQAVSQHTPSTQWFDAHCAEVLHTDPSGFGPQDPLASQVKGATQSASLLQMFTHASVAPAMAAAPGAHMKGAQLRNPGGWQIPCPSHVPAVFSMLPEQLGATQVISAAKTAQLPSPSQTPVFPQDDCGSATQRGWGWPAPNGKHWPAMPVWLQDTHSPVQAVLQQTPSAQCSEMQSASALQGPRPLGRGPQLLLLHLCPAKQSLSVVHFSRQAVPLHE